MLGIIRIVQGIVGLIASDGTPIGNVGDRLKVDAGEVDIHPPHYEPEVFVYEDFDFTRDTEIPGIFTDLYSYTGSGMLICTLINFDSDSDIYVRINVDGYQILFGSNGLSLNDVSGSNYYNIKALLGETACGLAMHGNTLRFNPSYPFRFNNYIKIQAKSNGKKFKAGFVSMNKFS